MKHFFDVGANIGQTFDKYLLKTNDYDGYKVWCFEPSPRNMMVLVETAKRVTSWDQKSVHDFSVVICPFGLWNKDGCFTFYEKSDPKDPWGRENGEGDSFVKEFITNSDTGYQINAVTVSASKFIWTNIMPEDEIVIKLDCEGGEYGILEDLLANGTVLKQVKKIIVEWHTTDEAYKKEGLIKSYLEIGLPLEDWPY